jgi:hypothetical protein
MVGSLLGFQWSQFTAESTDTILPGTVVETVDELCGWSGETNRHLPKVKVSDTPGSPAVYGVFIRWSEALASDAVIASLGAGYIRLHAGEPRRRGALLESAGNGCARIQQSPNISASTIGKITSTMAIDLYPDGSVLVPCTLQCG